MRLGRTSSTGTVDTAITVGSNAPTVTVAHLWRLSTLTAIREMKQTLGNSAIDF